MEPITITLSDGTGTIYQQYVVDADQLERLQLEPSLHGVAQFLESSRSPLVYIEEDRDEWTVLI